MPTRAEVIAASVNTGAVHYNGGGVSYVVQKQGSPDTLYIIFVDTASDLMYTKSTNGGITWGAQVTIFTGTVVAHACWYERWSGISGDKIHIVYTEAGGNDILYRSLDISSDTLGTQTTVLAGTSSAAGGALTITVGRNGHLRVAGSIDAGAEDGAWSSTDAGATWGDTIADPSEGATQDQYYLLPGWNADTADVMLIFGDASTNGLSVKRYDDSANTWSESTIIADGSWIDVAASNHFPHVACFVDSANSRNIVAAWTAVDTLNADLRCFIITDTSVTETSTNIVQDSTDDQGLCAMAIDTITGKWYVFYCGKTDGSETFTTSVKVYYKTSTDDGATWSSETALTNNLWSITWLAATPRFAGKFAVAFQQNTAVLDSVMVSAALPISPRARTAIGVS